MSSSISFILDNHLTTIDFEREKKYAPTTTVLQFLRSLANHKGTKEGCAEGDCGACTIVLASPGNDGRLRYHSLDSCLMFLPMLHGKQVITVENLRAPDGNLHPVQTAMLNAYGSQCGFCTPGVVMSLFALYKNTGRQRADIEEFLTGNLCRCTGYQPILDAAFQICREKTTDHFYVQESAVYQLLSQIKKTNLFIQTDECLYARPVSLQEALRLKHKFPGALIINGATDVALRVTKKFEKLNQIIDLSGIEALKKIKSSADSVIYGAGVSLQDIKSTAGDRFPALQAMLSVFGSLQIRNLATLGGNLATASPIGDSAPVLIAYDAQVVLQSMKRTRSISVTDFITGYRQTAARDDELITAVKIPLPEDHTKVVFYKFSKRKDLDISTVSAGFRLVTDPQGIAREIRLAFGGLAEKTMRAVKTEQALTGKKWTYDTIEKNLSLLTSEFHPISDARASAEGRRLAAGNLLLKFWHETATESEA